MKLTPLLLFLLLLVVLVIAVITLKNPIVLDKQEGFVQFKTNVVPQTETVVPPYSSRSIVKLYDNLFIDRKNANIVEVVGTEFTGNIDEKYLVTKGDVDLSGSSITAINIQTRDGTISNYPVTNADIKDTKESQISSINSSYNVVPFYTTTCDTTGKYQLFYVPWNTDTYVHAIQITASPSDALASSFKPKNVFTYRIPSDSSVNINATIYSSSVINLTAPASAPASADTSSSQNTLTTEPLYSATVQVYQLSSDVKFDSKNGNLIVNGTGSVIVYDRTGKPTTYTTAPAASVLPTEISNTSYAPWIVNNANNTTQILYIQSEKLTVVALFQTDTANRYKMINIARFNETGIDNGTTPSPQPAPTPSPQPEQPGASVPPGPPGPPTPSPDVNPSAISDYYKWYWYWNSAGPGTNAQFSNNYLLKTQIVPPVCPSCPSANCASGSASSGSSGSSGSSTSINKDGNIISNTVDSAGNVVNKTVDTAGNVVNKTLDTAGNLVNKTIDTTSGLVTSGATGAANLLTSGASGAANLVTSGVSGATNLLRDAGSGIVNVADKTLDTTGNVLGSLTRNANTVGGNGAYYGGLNTPYGRGYSAPGFSQGSPPIDNYSYYGALPKKGTNYIPITADFSAFGK
jgi:hypothetical protein